MTGRTPAQAGRSNRRRGHDWERSIVTYLRESGYPAADRQLHGKSSDVEGVGDLCIEAKNLQDWSMIPAALDQSWRDAARRGLDRGVVWKKRMGNADPGMGYWVGTIWRELAFHRRAEELEAMAAAEDWKEDFPAQLAALQELGRRHPGELADIAERQRRAVLGLAAAVAADTMAARAAGTEQECQQ